MGAMTVANALVPANVAEAVQLAETIAKASLVPKHLQNKPGDCLLVVMQAQRWGMDALSVAQCTSIVHGRLCYEGKLVAAVLYSMGAVEGRLHYEIKGSGQNASIVVTGTPRGGNGPQSVTGTVKDWRTFGKDKETGQRIDNAWDKMPEDMLVYRGTRQWARRYAPEALLGVYTPDEMDDDAPQAPRASLQPERASKADPNVIEGEAREIPASELRDETEQPAQKQAEQPQQQAAVGELNASMRKVLESKLSAKALSWDDLQAGFGAVTPSNINAALKWIGEQGAKA
jgi:hypothetical protein